MDTEDGGHTPHHIYNFDAIHPWLSAMEPPSPTALESTVDDEPYHRDPRFEVLQPFLSTVQPQPRHIQVLFESPYSRKRYRPGVGYLNNEPPRPREPIISDRELYNRLNHPRYVNDQELWNRLGGLDTECQDCLNRRSINPTPPSNKPKGILKSCSMPNLKAARCSCFNCGGFWREDGCLCKVESEDAVPRQDYDRKHHQLQSRATSGDLRSDFNFNAPPTPNAKEHDRRKEWRGLKSKAGRGIEKFWRLIAARRGH